MDRESRYCNLVLMVFGRWKTSLEAGVIIYIRWTVGRSGKQERSDWGRSERRKVDGGRTKCTTKQPEGGQKARCNSHGIRERLFLNVISSIGSYASPSVMMPSALKGDREMKTKEGRRDVYRALYRRSGRQEMEAVGWYETMPHRVYSLQKSSCPRRSLNVTIAG